MQRYLKLTFIVASALALLTGHPSNADPALAPNWVPPSDAEIRKLLVQIVDVRHQSLGVVIGVIGPSGRRVIAYGRRDQVDPRPLDGDTEFEIASISKVFTGLVLADMARRGEVSLTDPAAKCLPAGLRMPPVAGQNITLADLATDTSGLPRDPTNLDSKDVAGAYAHYSLDDLNKFLSSYVLPHAPPAPWAYSNLGFGILGLSLSCRAGESYEALVKERLLQPLGMSSTSISLTADEAARLAPGHDPRFNRVSPVNLGLMAGAGSFRSTANDLLTLLAAELGYAPTPLRQDFDFALATDRPSKYLKVHQTLGWPVVDTPVGPMMNQEGGNSGYLTYAAYMPRQGYGVVVLMNTRPKGLDADDIGDYILAGHPMPNP